MRQRGTGFEAEPELVLRGPGAWERLSPRFAAVERPVVFVGDECLGWRNYRLASYLDVLASLQIYDMRVLDWFLPLLPTESQARFNEGLEEDIEQLRVVAHEEAHGNWHNAKDYLYLDQRLGNLILPWREACIPEGVALRSPLLDNDILDFMMNVPVRYRLNKRLYRKTIMAMYPQLFSIPRSSSTVNFYLNLAREFAANATEITKLIDAKRSRLDELVPPDVLKRLLATLVTGNASESNNGKTTGKYGLVERLLGRTLGRLTPRRPTVPTVKQADLLMRLFVLRLALADSDD